MLNRREKSEVQAALSAKMCRLEPPSLTVDSKPENALNTACPRRSPSWILPAELMTPARATTKSPNGPPVAYGPSPITQQYRPAHDLPLHLHNGETENNAKKENVICFVTQWRWEEPEKKSH